MRTESRPHVRGCGSNHLVSAQKTFVYRRINKRSTVSLLRPHRYRCQCKRRRHLMMFAVETLAQVFVLHGDHVEQGTDSQFCFRVSQLFQGSLVEMLLFRLPLLITAVQFDVIFVHCCSCVLFKNKHQVKSCIKSGSTFRITFVAGRLACSCTSPGGLSDAQDCKNTHNHFAC